MTAGTKAHEDEIASLFLTPELREKRRALKQTIEKNVLICAEVMTTLVLANHEGDRMDVIKSMVAKLPRFGGKLTPKQHGYAASIILKSHLDEALGLMVAAERGEDIVVGVAPEPAPKAAQHEGLTEANPFYGMF